MGPWITTDDLSTALAFSLNVAPSQIANSPKWPTIVGESLQSATDDITSALLGRGYTVAQIDAWDRRVEFSKDLGRYWCFVRGNLANTYNDVLINKMDRRKELKDIPIYSGGVLIFPPDSPDGPGTYDDVDGGGVISGGRMNQDYFTFPLSREF